MKAIIHPRKRPLLGETLVPPERDDLCPCNEGRLARSIDSLMPEILLSMPGKRKSNFL
jgi:hypothetical protein